MKERLRKTNPIFSNHQDVLTHLPFGERVVLARRRISSYRSYYEFIRSFSDKCKAREYARSHLLEREKYVMLFVVRKSRLSDIPI